MEVVQPLPTLLQGRTPSMEPGRVYVPEGTVPSQELPVKPGLEGV